MGDDTNALSLGVAGLVGAGALGGIVVARRRLQQ
ncbi:LPXTG cell wall anchor domain-containing protein [Dermacoccus nishinomiyaensis]|nr:LPXTG cell wall anchor domain-containing protein [Dermacoccus nishinomiyaensis]